jgi:hypothetical protein
MFTIYPYFSDLPLAPTALVLNGHAVMAGDDVPIVKPVALSQSASSSTGAIPKSISFDKTAERGDKVSMVYKEILHPIFKSV